MNKENIKVGDYVWFNKSPSQWDHRSPVVMCEVLEAPTGYDNPLIRPLDPVDIAPWMSERDKKWIREDGSFRSAEEYLSPCSERPFFEYKTDLLSLL